MTTPTDDASHPWQEQPPPVPVTHARLMWNQRANFWKKEFRIWKALVAVEARDARATCERPTIRDVPTLALEVANARDLDATLGSKVPIGWSHEVWALDPRTGDWYRARHDWPASPFERSKAKGPQQCLVCCGHVVDKTTSVATFFWDLEREYVDGREAFAKIPIGLHNAGKKWAHLADDKGYATLTWKCRRHGTFRATMGNRTHAHGGTGCPKCGPRSMSKEQIRVAFEIMSVFPDTDPDPDAIAVPDRLRAEWGTPVVRPDILIPSLDIDVEYDGEGGHRRFGDTAADDSRQTRVLNALGIDVIRLVLNAGQAERENVVFDGRNARVSLASPATPFESAAAALKAIQQLRELDDERVGEYLRGGRARNQGAAAEAIRALWSTSGRRWRKRTQMTVSKRRLRAITVGTRFGRLIVTGPAKLDPTTRGESPTWYPLGATVDGKSLFRLRTSGDLGSRRSAAHCNAL